MTNNRNKLIIWDFDGTIYHSPASYEEYARCIGRAMGEDENEFVSHIMAIIEDSSRNQGEDGWAIIANIARDRVGNDLLNQCFARTRELMNRGIIPVNLSDSALNILRDQRVYHILLTNTPEKYAMPMIRNFRIDSYFDRIYCSASKPGGFCEKVRSIMETYPIPPENIMSIGDNYTNDIIPSLEMGLITVYIQNYPRDSKANITVKKLEDALHFIKNFIEG
ncbi:MAG: HAD family hydrolase [Cuniculiplasma sp.]